MSHFSAIAIIMSSLLLWLYLFAINLLTIVSFFGQKLITPNKPFFGLFAHSWLYPGTENGP